MKIVFGLAFAVAAVIQIWACYQHHRRVRAITKVFLMTTLLGFYLCVAPDVTLWIVAALLFSFVGDVLLLNDSWLTAGGISFFFAHVCYIAAYSVNISFSEIPVWFTAVAAAGYGLLFWLMMRVFRGHVSRKHFVAGAGYLAAVCAMSFFALMQLFGNGGFAFLSFAGTLLFLLSDFVLLVREYRKGILPFKHKYTIVMVTYMLAQALIVCGMMHI